NKFVNSEHKNGAEKELIQSLTQYRAEQKSLNADENVNTLIKKLLQKKTFREVWEKTQNIDHEKMIDNYTFADYVIPARNKTKGPLKFHLFNVPLLDDPRISIEFHSPADKKTFEYFENE